MNIKVKYFKYLLYVYTFVIVLVSVFTAFSFTTSRDRVALADPCTQYQIDTCVQQQINYCYTLPQLEQPSCAEGAYNRCMAPDGDALVCNSITDIDSDQDNTQQTQPGCNPVYQGNSFKLEGTDCDGWMIYRCSTGYTPQLASSCFVNDNCYPVEEVQVGKVYTADPGIGQCAQVDYRPANDPSQGGGVCDCQPPVQEPPSCNGECNNSDKLCSNGLSCINVDGTSRCRLPSNPSSATCQPTTTVTCNDLCNNSDKLCPSGLSCVAVDGQNRCRLPSNQSSATCQPVQENPNYTIDKYVDGGRTNYNIGDLVTFKIRITNTGSTTLTNIQFRDVYNSNYLTYVGGSAIKSSGGSISEINSVLTRNISGTIEIENILSTNILGSLSVGNYIEVTVRFIAKAPINETCNYGYIDAPDLPEISDNACVSSKNIDTDV